MTSCAGAKVEALVERVDAVVVGAGVIGLAIARELALKGFEVVILERCPSFGTGISSRNSEVIHAGVYYPPGSLKASLCVQGRRMLYDYCSSRGIAHRRCGKLIVATSREEDLVLDGIARRAAASGVSSVARISAGAARDMEPSLACLGALHSPETGIVDSHALMTSLLGDAQHNGAVLATDTPFMAARRDGPLGWVVTSGTEPAYELGSRWIVNCAGLGAPGVAARIEGVPPGSIPAQWLAKGNYFSLRGRSPFTRLVYPAPVAGGLGIHLTLDLAGHARFGPDVEWLGRDHGQEEMDYGVSWSRLPDFERAIRRYWPDLPDDSLHPAYSGVRPKLSGPSEEASDFAIFGPDELGLPGIVNLFGIESPGLTSAFSIAAMVAALLTAESTSGTSSTNHRNPFP
jgi:L-2-hydroxyglutarate oxidase LhgO